MRLTELAYEVVTSAATPTSAANLAPATIDESLTAMSDGYRVMLLSARQGDRKARQQAIATMPMWFDDLPQTVRNNITFKVDARLPQNVSARANRSRRLW